MARTRRIRGGGKISETLKKMVGIKKTTYVPPRRTPSQRLREQRLMSRRLKRQELLKSYSTRSVPRLHKSIKEAPSPEILHAFITRLSHLPLQPLIHYVHDESVDLEIDEETQVFYDKEKATPNFVKSIQNTAGFALPGAETDEESLILKEALYPTGLVRIETETNKCQDTDRNDNCGTYKVQFKERPFIQKIIRDAVREDYDGVDMFDIPIFFAIEAPIPGGGHMSILVMYRTVFYSLGFGFGAQKSIAVTEHKTKLFSQGSFYNPDYLITPKDIFSPIPGRKEHEWVYKYRIVDMGYLKPIHLARINELLVHCTEFADIEFEDEYFKTTTLYLNKHYHGLSYSPYVCLSKGGAMNCTTFIEYVFRERINCGVVPGISISLPSFCKRKNGKLTNGHVKKWFNEYESPSHSYSEEMNRILMGL